jgi:hypothetical protein
VSALYQLVPGMKKEYFDKIALDRRAHLKKHASQVPYLSYTNSKSFMLFEEALNPIKNFGLIDAIGKVGASAQ